MLGDGAEMTEGTIVAAKACNDDQARSAILIRYRAFQVGYDLWCRLRACGSDIRGYVIGNLVDCNGVPDNSRAWADDRLATALHAMAWTDRQETEMLERCGYYECEAAANAACARTGRLANEIFAIPARDQQELTIKLRILRLALGRHGTADDGDEDLAAHQADAEEPWFDSVMRDAERLSGFGGVGDDWAR